MKKGRGLFYISCINWMILVLALSIAVPLLIRPFYYAHIKPYHLEEESGYTEAQIKEAYDDMMDYCVYGIGEFKTGVMPFSEEGKAHFEDCAVLFRIDFVLALISVITAVILTVYQRKKGMIPLRYGHTPQYFAGYFLGGGFLLIGILCALDFDKAFVVFHTIFFPGKTNWIFDWNDDQIIRIMPEEFFRNAGILIVALLFTGCAALILYDRRKVRNSTN